MQLLGEAALSRLPLPAASGGASSCKYEGFLRCVSLLDIFTKDEMSQSCFFMCEFVLFSDSMDVAATAAGSSVIVVEVNAYVVANANAASATFSK